VSRSLARPATTPLQRSAARRPAGEPPAGYVDARGPRFGAAVTTVVLAAVLLLQAAGDTPAGILLAVQTVIFAVGTLGGLRRAPYGLLFRSMVRPRLAPPASLELEALPRFAQGVGLAFAAVGTIGYLTGVTALGTVATALALAAAFLNAAFDFCLGCELNLLLRRALSRPRPQRYLSPAKG
jgi:Domain of unknown function (DUF4395)